MRELGADWWSSSCFSSAAEKCMRRTAADAYCDGFLTIESGKTLTFIVKEFLNDLVCKQGSRSGRRKGKEVRTANFTVGFYGFYGSFVEYKMDFLRLRERETLDPFVLRRKHHWLPPSDRVFTIVILDRWMLAEASISSRIALNATQRATVCVKVIASIRKSHLLFIHVLSLSRRLCKIYSNRK